MGPWQRGNHRVRDIGLALELSIVKRPGQVPILTIFL